MASEMLEIAFVFSKCVYKGDRLQIDVFWCAAQISKVQEPFSKWTLNLMVELDEYITF